MKIHTVIVILLVASLFGGGVAQAAELQHPPRYTDSVGLLDSQQETELTAEERREAHIISAAVSIAIALIVPLIIVTVWTNQLKSVKPKDTASDYVIQGSLMLTSQRDIFLYRNVTRVARDSGNRGGGGGGFSGGFSSSSGRSFSGRSGKF